MARPITAIGLLLSIMLVSASILFPTASAQQSCSSLTFTVNGRNRVFSRCNSLSALGSSLHWTYNPAEGTAEIAYRAPQPGASGWIAWGINPTSRGMIGTQALVAVLNGGTASVFTTQVTSRAPEMQQQNLTFPVTAPSVDSSGGALTIFATVSLPDNRTTLAHTWQSSTSLANGVPVAHPINGPNVLSSGTIDFLSGTASAGGGRTILHRKNIHGVLNTVSWGILMPIGVMIARYMRVFPSADPAWFHLHRVCQSSAYVIGVIGWGYGLKLGADSKGITYGSHRAMGIALFCLATLQVFALFLRPNKEHKYRIYWNVYHHLVGYTTIILSFFNILKGFKMLKPDKKYKRSYVGVVITLGAIAVTLEVITWIIVINRRKRERASGKNQQQQSNGMYGANRQAQMI